MLLEINAFEFGPLLLQLSVTAKFAEGR